jgi:hypothetical protein
MPGLQAQVDRADFQIAEPNGKTSTVYLFILVLGYCRAIYAEFVNRCTLESFLDGHIRAFHYLGGIPAEILYDNMRHVVIRHLVGKVAFNPELLHFAHHYGFAPKARRMRPRSRARWNGRWTTSGRASGGAMLSTSLRVPTGICTAGSIRWPTVASTAPTGSRSWNAGSRRSPSWGRCRRRTTTTAEVGKLLERLMWEGVSDEWSRLGRA